MQELLTVRGLTRRYDRFTLDHIDFSLPYGSIMGLMGDNGAGKTTTLKLILNLIRRDEGEVLVFGKDNITCEREIKEEIGVVFDECHFSDLLRPADLGRIFSQVYRRWDSASYKVLLDRFSLPGRAEIKTLSRGMKMKLSLACALAHHPRLLILDEATGGLDPVARSELLDLLLEFIQDESRSVLVSSHIISDLERICDTIGYLRRGRPCPAGTGVPAAGAPPSIRMRRFGGLPRVNSESPPRLGARPRNARGNYVVLCKGGRTVKGLLLKDLYTMRSYLRTLAVMFVFYIVLGFVSRTSSFFAAFVGVLCIVMTVTSYAYDQTCGWNLYGASLPVSRREMVRSKYLLALLLSAAGILVTLLAHLLFVLGGRGGTLAEILPNALGAGASGFLIVIILLPVLYRFGVEKGRLVMMILAAGIMGGIFLMAQISPGIHIPEDRIRAVLWSVPAVLAVMLVISYSLSCRFFEAKDL